MKKILAGVALAALAVAGIAVAQTYSLPQVTSINPGADLVQVVPGGSPKPGSVYASVALLRSGSADGIAAVPLRLLDFKNNDGTTLVASAASGKYGLTSTPGTVEQLVTEVANNNTKTDTAQFESIVPSGYVAGSNITLTCNGQYVLGAGTIGTHTLTAAAYLTAAAGTQGATLIATAAQSVPATAGSMVFTITGATLVPGSRLMLTFAMAIQDTGSSNITGNLNSCTLS